MKNRRARKLKTRLIEPGFIQNHLPRTKEGEIDWHASIRVVYPDGMNTAMDVSPWELLELASAKIVCGQLTRGEDSNRHEIEYFTKAILIASVHAAWRIVRGLRRPVMKADFISRAHQSPGAKKWVKRHDRAKPGRSGSVDQLAFTIREQIYVPAEESTLRSDRSGRTDRRRRMGDLGRLPELLAPASQAA